MPAAAVIPTRRTPSMQRRGRDTQRDMRTEHAFAPDHAHLDTRTAFDRRHHGDEPVSRKIYVAHRLSGFAQHVGQYHWNLFAQRKQTRPMFARKPRDQIILSGCQNGAPVVIS